MKTLLAAAFVLSALTAQAKEATGADAQAIDSACAAEAATTGCGTEKVGTGLLKCLHAYHQAHKDAKPSAGCKAAMEKARADRQAK